jgi:hypothetical protein
MAGFAFELPATVEDMLDTLETTPGALPLLQFTASKLWESRDKARKLLTHNAYTQMGGVTGALASHADRVVQELGAAKMPLVRAIMLRLVSPERTRAIVPMAELRELSREVGEVQRLVDQMVDARLLVVQTIEGGKGSTVEIVHESLVQNWPTLRRWLDENQDDAELIDQLRTAARQWAQKGRDVGLLWRGETAEEAKKFKKRYKGPLSDVERAFLEAVVTYEVQQARKRRTMVIAGFVALGAVVVAAMIALVIIQKSRATATANARKAEQESIKAVAAQKTAEQALAEAQEKERQRVAAEAAQKTAETKTTVVTQQLGVAEQDLAKKNIELEAALAVSKENEEKAKIAAARAEAESKKAVAAAEEAQKARDKAEAERVRAENAERAQKARADRFEAQMGSKSIEELK